MDYKVLTPKEDITFDDSTQTSTVTLPFPSYSDKEMSALSATSGRYFIPTFDATTATMIGDWTDDDLFLGYNFNCKVELPTFFVTQDNTKRVIAQTTKDLIIHRAKFSFGSVGYYEIELDRKGMDNYNFTFEGRLADQYLADSDYVLSESVETVPIYTRNRNFDLTISSDHPSPFILYSMTWEGDYNNRYYKPI